MPRKRDTASAPDRNAEVAELVRLRRTQLRVPDGASYSQEAVAERVGAVERTYRGIENGELRHRDPTVLDAIARELDMTPGQRRALFLIFNGHEPTPLTAALPPDCLDDHKAIINSLPHIAYITDERWNVLAVNDTVRATDGDFTEGVNVFEFILGREESKELFVNWYDVWAVRTLRSLKTMAAVSRDPFLIALHKKLRRGLERADDVIGSFEPSGEIRSLRRPDGSILTFRYQIYRLMSDQPSQYRLVNLVPVNDAPVPESDSRARENARRLDRDLCSGPWRIPERG